MKKILIALVPILVGIGLLIWGVGFHSRTIYFDQEIEIEAPPLEDDPLFGPPDEPPPEASQKVAVLEERQATDPEHHLVLEVSRGGVQRLPDGKIKRTYIAGEDPPDLCPT